MHVRVCVRERARERTRTYQEVGRLSGELERERPR